MVAWTLFGLVNWRLVSSLSALYEPTLRARVQARELLDTCASNTIYRIKPAIDKVMVSGYITFFSQYSVVDTALSATPHI